MLVKRDISGKSKTIYMCDICKKTIESDSDNIYKVTVGKSPRFYTTHRGWHFCEKCFKEIDDSIEKKEEKRNKTYLYNPTKKTIRENVEGSQVLILHGHETRLIEVLCNGKTNTWEEVCNYVFGYSDEYAKHGIIQLKGRILNKIKLHINTVRSIGLRLEDKIYIG